ncbi:Zinc finger RING FYVE PHD-type [Pyrenophora seminiperda CCB06]|uniref:Zinc finger RING FYVE PHD-type n=1 Tax=Pyrenophora seminiperda CCB06 TaxID=1302712 RepID=A0A3M7MD96_9PLEO|nr:Zinc finger RING FYVE PHD-type [Pyrenophora seminiperda CCB06]
MTTPGDGGPPDKGKNVERGTLGKYVKRMSTVFRREKSSKTVPVSAPEAPSTSKNEQEQAAKTTEEPVKQDATKPQVIPVTCVIYIPHGLTFILNYNSPITPSVSAPPTPTTRTAMDRNAMQQERARALFAKYGLTLESHEWIAAPAAKPTVERVEKSIRMRVHRSCHRCGTLYGADKVCRQCEHKRCKKCPRYPKKKTAEEKQTEKEKEGTEQPKRKRKLTIRTRAGDELVYQPARQRIRRTCHVCDQIFIPAAATVCENCQHVRCTRCAREPAKLSKWPTGYPGDAAAEPDSETEVEKQLEKFRRTWRKPRMRVRWQCEQCSSLFLNNSPQCPGCGHERCDKCTRSP